MRYSERLDLRLSPAQMNNIRVLALGRNMNQLARAANARRNVTVVLAMSIPTLMVMVLLNNW